MNGAIGEASAKTTSIPRSTSMIMMGASQNFFLSVIYDQISDNFSNGIESPI